MMYVQLDRQGLYWPLLDDDVYQVFQDFKSFLSDFGTSCSHQKHLRLFHSNGPLEYFSMHLLGPLKKTNLGNQNALVITYRYSNLTRAIKMAKKTKIEVSAAFIYHSVIPYCIPNYVLSYNGQQFVSKHFASVCGYLGA